MKNHNNFDNYRQLLQRVDDKFQEIVGRRPDQYSCKAGCFACCRSGLTVTNIEKEHIKSWLLSHPALIQELKKLQDDPPHAGAQCRLLNKDGRCTIYPVRPIVCRSHGAPIRFKVNDGSGETALDVCPLNLENISLDQLAADENINLETLNAILSVIDRHFDAENAGNRYSLSIDELLL